MIEQPGYNRERAIQCGEAAGAWYAEYQLSGQNSSYCYAMFVRYRNRACWYARQAYNE